VASFQQRYAESEDLTRAHDCAPKLKELYQKLRAVHDQTLLDNASDPTLLTEEEQWLTTCKTLAEQVGHFVPGFTLE
jgi:hypothetical protein